MLELFQPSFSTLTTSPLPLSPESAKHCLAVLNQLVQSKPAKLNATQYAAVQTAFIAGYAKFAAGTDDYSSLNLSDLEQTARRAFSPYTLEVVSSMLTSLDNVTSDLVEYCTLTDGSVLYNTGERAGEQMVSFSKDITKSVTLNSALSMTNEAVLYYAD